MEQISVKSTLISRRSMASRRQQELVSIKEEKEKKEAEKGPAWYYIPVGIKVLYIIIHHFWSEVGFNE